jgi:hypothetical protein
VLDAVGRDRGALIGPDDDVLADLSVLLPSFDDGSCQHVDGHASSVLDDQRLDLRAVAVGAGARSDFVDRRRFLRERVVERDDRTDVVLSGRNHQRRNR